MRSNGTVQGTTHKKLEALRYGLTGRIPNGMLFRVSSIDRDEGRAYELQDQFVNRLLQQCLPSNARA